MEQIHPRAYKVELEDGRVYRRNRAWLRPDDSTFVLNAAPASEDQAPRDNEGQFPLSVVVGPTEDGGSVDAPSRKEMTTRYGRQVKPKVIFDPSGG